MGCIAACTALLDQPVLVLCIFPPEFRGWIHIAISVRARLSSSGTAPAHRIPLPVATTCFSESIVRPHGICYCDSKVFVANAKGGLVNVYGGNDYALLEQIDFKEEPDNLLFDSRSNRVYVGFGDGESLTPSTSPPANASLSISSSKPTPRGCSSRRQARASL